MTPEQAANELGLTFADMRPGWGSDIRDAYAAQVLADHPDHGGAGTRHRALKKARDTLLAHFEGAPAPKRECAVCKGAGTVRSGFKAVPCPRGCAPGKQDVQVTKFGPSVRRL